MNLSLLFEYKILYIKKKYLTLSLYVGLIYMSVDMLALIKLLYINHLKVFAYRSTLLVINIWFQLGAALRAPVEAT